MPESTRSRTVALCALVFAVALLPRLAWVALTPHLYPIDLTIYAADGELVANGVNPYDPSQGTVLRERIFDFHHRVLGMNFPPTLESWNYYVASNLPLTQLFLGAVWRLSPSPTALRIAFSIGDSLAAVLLFLLVRWHWRGASSRLAALVALGAALNPLFLLWGTIYPEDKGIQTLLLLAVILLTLRPSHPNSWPWLALAGVLLAASITFKGFGVFLAPAVLAHAWRVGKVRGVALTGIISAAGILAVTLPVLGAVTKMSSLRLSSNSLAAPTHASIWVYPYRIFPTLGSHNAHIFVAVILGILIAYFAARRRINLEVAGGLMCFDFAIVALVEGSLDRMMIGVMIALVALGIHRTTWGIAGSAIWAAAGVIGIAVFAHSEAGQGLVVLLATLLVVLALWLRLPDRLSAHSWWPELATPL